MSTNNEVWQMCVNAARMEGFAAARVGESKNSYKPGSGLYLSWQAGYTEGLNYA